MIGYKSQLIKKYLKKYKKLKFSIKKLIIFLKMATHLHGTNLNNFGKFKKKVQFLFHADILFSEKYLNNLIRSNSKILLGVKKITKKIR